MRTPAPAKGSPRFVTLVLRAVYLNPDASVGQKVKRLVERKAIGEAKSRAEFKPHGEGARADGGEDFRAAATFGADAILRLARGAAVARIPASRPPNGKREGIFAALRNGAIPSFGRFRENGNNFGRAAIDTDIRMESVKTAWNAGACELDAAYGAFRTAGYVGWAKDLAGDIGKTDVANACLPGEVWQNAAEDHAIDRNSVERDALQDERNAAFQNNRSGEVGPGGNADIAPAGCRRRIDCALDGGGVLRYAVTCCAEVADVEVPSRRYSVCERHDCGEDYALHGATARKE